VGLRLFLGCSCIDPKHAQQPILEEAPSRQWLHGQDRSPYQSSPPSSAWAAAVPSQQAPPRATAPAAPPGAAASVVPPGPLERGVHWVAQAAPAVPRAFRLWPPRWIHLHGRHRSGGRRGFWPHAHSRCAPAPRSWTPPFVSGPIRLVRILAKQEAAAHDRVVGPAALPGVRRCCQQNACNTKAQPARADWQATSCSSFCSRATRI